VKAEFPAIAWCDRLNRGMHAAAPWRGICRLPVWPHCWCSCHFAITPTSSPGNSALLVLTLWHLSQLASRPEADDNARDVGGRLRPHTNIQTWTAPGASFCSSEGSMRRKSAGGNLITLPVRSILHRMRRLVVLITVPCGGEASKKL